MGNGITDADGNPIAGSRSTDFHVLPGEADRDGSVAFADLVILAQHYGRSGRTFSQGNVDHPSDGPVSSGDLATLARRYGTAVAAVAARRGEASPLASSHGAAGGRGIAGDVVR